VIDLGFCLLDQVVKVMTGYKLKLAEELHVPLLLESYSLTRAKIVNVEPLNDDYGDGNCNALRVLALRFQMLITQQFFS